jgi:hypothetical protein
MDAVIYNITDLRNEIARLKAAKTIQEEAIKSHFNGPVAIFHTITGLFKGTSPTDVKNTLFGNQDIIGLASRVILPFILNKTIFRSSNFIIKAAIGLLSQKASGFISEESITSVWDKIKSFIPKKKAAKKTDVDYGIPPYSESY